MNWVELWERIKLAEHEARMRARQIAEEARRQARERYERERAADLERRRAAKQVRCGAKTRAGHPCKRKGLGNNGRCPNHGGLSTGPKTKAGRRRIALAQRERWKRWREERAHQA